MPVVCGERSRFPVNHGRELFVKKGHCDARLSSMRMHGDLSPDQAVIVGVTTSFHNLVF